MNMVKRWAVALVAAVCLAVPALAGASVDRGVYILGDSYTVLMQKQGLNASMPGWTVLSAGRGGRNVGVAPSPNGLQQAAKDRAKIARSGTVVIELGTNLGDRSRFILSMRTLIARVHLYNATARVMWVEPGNFTTDHDAQEIHAQRIRDMRALLPAADTVRWEPVAHAHPEWFTADPKHPNVEGTRALIDLIGGAVTG